MLISEIAVELTNHYRQHKAENGGHKTAPKGKYGFKTIRYKVTESDGTVHGPFLGRGSALTAYKTEIKEKGKALDGVQFIVESVFVPKTKGKEPVVDGAVTFPLTQRVKKG